MIRAMGRHRRSSDRGGAWCFAFTMISMVTSDLRSVGQIGLHDRDWGLLFDTFIVRTLITPSIAALAGPLVSGGR